jgi:hypothetical protein
MVKFKRKALTLGVVLVLATLAGILFLVMPVRHTKREPEWYGLGGWAYNLELDGYSPYSFQYAIVGKYANPLRRYNVLVKSGMLTVKSMDLSKVKTSLPIQEYELYINGSINKNTKNGIIYAKISTDQFQKNIPLAHVWAHRVSNPTSVLKIGDGLGGTQGNPQSSHLYAVELTNTHTSAVRIVSIKQAGDFLIRHASYMKGNVTSRLITIPLNSIPFSRHGIVVQPNETLTLMFDVVASPADYQNIYFEPAIQLDVNHRSTHMELLPLAEWMVSFPFTNIHSPMNILLN